MIRLKLEIELLGDKSMYLIEKASGTMHAWMSFGSKGLLQRYCEDNSGVTLKLSHSTEKPLHQVRYVENRRLLGLIKPNRVITDDILDSTDNHNVRVMVVFAGEIDYTDDYHRRIKYPSKDIIRLPPNGKITFTDNNVKVIHANSSWESYDRSLLGFIVLVPYKDYTTYGLYFYYQANCVLFRCHLSYHGRKILTVIESWLIELKNTENLSYSEIDNLTSNPATMAAYKAVFDSKLDLRDMQMKSQQKNNLQRRLGKGKQF